MSIIKNCSYLRWIRSRAIPVLLLVLPSTALASLGGNLDSLQADRAKMNATLRINPASNYAVHEMTTPHGTLVREYVSPEGRVFGVAWQGPFIPDMHQLLGSYFAHFSAAARKQGRNRSDRHFVIVHEPNLFVETTGHMLSYSGRAFDPQLLPQGVTGDEIR